MRKWLVTLIVCFFAGISLNSFCQPYVVYDTIPIRHGTSKIRLTKNIDKWFKKEKGQRLIAKNRKELIFKGKGYFPYANYVRIPDIYLSSHAAEKTKGSIVFNIEVRIEDSIIVTKFSNFLHEARFTEYGTTSFGRLMDYEKVPSGKCMEVEEWCNAVWADMKDWSYYETKKRAKNMIPSTLIRKRTFKVQEEEIKPPATKPYDPSEYLKLENYLLKDTEGKYADYNKDPEDIEAEKAAAAAALAEKEKKKNKEKEKEFDPEDDYETAESESAAEQSPAKPDTESIADDDNYDDGEDYPKAEKPAEKKEKTAKAPKKEKEKKPKKTKDEDEDDDYDDYDD